MANRRRFSPDFKVRVVLKLISDARACREYSVSPQTVSRRKIEFVEKAPRLFRHKEHESAGQARMVMSRRGVRVIYPHDVVQSAALGSTTNPSMPGPGTSVADMFR